ncbi:hypothetical protein Bbelb_311540 [Branchiostoma belcheri]|nr:hypothetical protein Bbelb_311540 [Branchiostoma belcheri]
MAAQSHDHSHHALWQRCWIRKFRVQHTTVANSNPTHADSVFTQFCGEPMADLYGGGSTVIPTKRDKEKSTGLERTIPCPTGAQCYSGNCGGGISIGNQAICCCGGSDMTVCGDIDASNPNWAQQIQCTCSY